MDTSLPSLIPGHSSNDAWEDSSNIHHTVQMLEEQIHQMKNCLTMLAHDLKNPLYGITLSSSMIREHLPADDPKLNTMINTIASSASQMSQHINNLLKKSSHGIVGFTPDLKTVDLELAVTRAVSNQKVQLLEQNITVSIKTTEEACMVQADNMAVDQIIDNLLSNAIKFSPKDTQILIEISPKGFSITDQGPGFTAEDQADLFKKFSCLSAKPTNGLPSSGLGLYICKQLTEALNAQIECISFPEQSACFQVTFAG